MLDLFFSSSFLCHAVSIQPAPYRGVGPPGVLLSLEQQAYMLLTEPERKTMGYYLQEYQDGHIGVESLVMALFELFNTHAKVKQWLFIVLWKYFYFSLCYSQLCVLLIAVFVLYCILLILSLQ